MWWFPHRSPSPGVFTDGAVIYLDNNVRPNESRRDARGPTASVAAQKIRILAEGGVTLGAAASVVAGAREGCPSVWVG